MARDCLVLLAYIEREHPANQSLRKLSEATGIARMTLWHIIDDAENTGHSMLELMAYKYGFQYCILPDWRNSNRHRNKLILDVVKAPPQYKY